MRRRRGLDQLMEGAMAKHGPALTQPDGSTAAVTTLAVR
jgi:hypothetical protein